MQAHWLHKNTESKTLILFFAGFASHYTHYTHLDSKVNVLLLHDYTDFTFDFSFNIDLELEKYDLIYLVAYSMGVSIAARLPLQHIPFSSKIALSGTETGIDKLHGINPAIFRHTIKNLNIDDFKKAIFGGNLDRAKDFHFASISHLKDELQYIYDFCITTPYTPLTWDRIYIAKNDTLFLPQTCYKAFNDSKHAICELASWHYPFFAFDTWEGLCAIS